MESFRNRLNYSCCFLPRLAFRYFGVSTNANDSVGYKFYSVFVLSVASTYPVNNMFVLLQNLNNFDIIINSVFNMVGGFSAFMKILVIVYNREQLTFILTQIERIQTQRNVEKFGQVKAYNMNKMTLGCMTLVFVPLACFFVATMIGRILINDYHKWILPISGVSFINISYSPNYEIAWTYQVIAVSILTAGFVLSDFLVASVIVDICIQLKIFTQRMTHKIYECQKTIQLDNKTLSSWDNLQNVIAVFVTDHLRIIQMVKQIEKILSALVFLDVFGNMGMICFALYYASVLPLMDIRALQVYLEIFGITIGLFFICYWGTEISLAGQAVGHACYDPHIIGTDIRFQRSLLLIAMRSQKPITISVGKFATLSITVFAWIIKNSYSYFMVLRKANENKA